MAPGRSRPVPDAAFGVDTDARNFAQRERCDVDANGMGSTPSSRCPRGATRNLVSGTNAIGAGTQVVPLRYASAKDLAKVLEPYVAEGGKIAADPAPNALIVSGDAAVRQTLVGLIRAFDIDILAGQSYALFPVGDSDPAKRASEFERVLQAQAEGALGGIVRVVPMDRGQCRSRRVVAARYIDAARRFFRLTNQLEDATARAWHVYYVQNGQSADLENLLPSERFTPRNCLPDAWPPGEHWRPALTS